MAKKIKQSDKVLSWLILKGDLTTKEAVTELNILCLPKRIEDLRKLGYRIDMTYKTAPSGARYGVYSLITD